MDNNPNEKKGEEGSRKRKRIRIVPISTSKTSQNNQDSYYRTKSPNYDKTYEGGKYQDDRGDDTYSSQSQRSFNKTELNYNRSLQQEQSQGYYRERKPNHYRENNNRNGFDRQDHNRKVSGRYNNPNEITRDRSYSSQRDYNETSRSNINREKPVLKKIIKPIKFKENFDPKKEVRLNKYLSNSGVCSRREADSLILAGKIKVNGDVITELGYKVTYSDEIKYNDKVVSPESKVYVLLNKPKNCVTTSDDPENRMTVMDLVKNACQERIYPVGRLDRNTTGVLLLTNDGDLASKLTHPKFKKKKIYQVTLDRDVAIEDMQAIADGIMLDDGEIHADSIAYMSEDRLNEVGIEIHSGRNRLVRRIFEKLNYKVFKLDRVYFAGLTKKNLPRGKWRYLTPAEVNMLRMGAFE